MGIKINILDSNVTTSIFSFNLHQEIQEISREKSQEHKNVDFHGFPSEYNSPFLTIPLPRKTFAIEKKEKTGIEDEYLFSYGDRHFIVSIQSENYFTGKERWEIYGGGNGLIYGVSKDKGEAILEVIDVLSLLLYPYPLVKY